MRNIVVRIAIVGLASAGMSSTALADSIAVSAGLLETPVAGLSELGSPVRIGPPGLALAGTLTSALGQFQSARDFSGRGRTGAGARQGTAASRTYGSGTAAMGGGGLGRRGHGLLEFRGSGSLGETLRPSAALPSSFTLTGPSSHRPAAPGASRSRSTPAVVVQHVDLPLPVAGAVGAVGPRADFAGAPGEPTPEPATLLLLGGGLGAAILHRRRRMKAAS